MAFRTQTSGSRPDLPIVEDRGEDGRTRQRVVVTRGRLDQLQQDGRLDALPASGARLSRSVPLLSASTKGQLPTITARRLGPAPISQRLGRQTGCRRVIEHLLDGRRFEGDVERAIFLTGLHRPFAPGSDRAADKWETDYRIDGGEPWQLHHLDRAMAWLGEELPRDPQKDKTPFAPRCTKDRIEEGVFARRRDLFTDRHPVFFDTTSISSEGEGGQDLGQRGFSKDHRPDLDPMVVGAVLDGRGRPIGCESWPGNTTDVTTPIPGVDRLRRRFGVRRVCLVADRGLIGRETIEALEQDTRGWQSILGARMRSQDEVKDEVLSRAGRYRVVHPPGIKGDDPSALEVKEVWVDDRRYLVCRNEDEARRDAADRAAIVAALREQLRRGDKSLVGSATRGTVATGAVAAPTGSGSMRRRSPPLRETTARGCWAATRSGTPPRPPCRTSDSGWWSGGPGRARRCYRPARSSTGVRRRSGVMSSARSRRRSSVRNSSPGWRSGATSRSGPM